MRFPQAQRFSPRPPKAEPTKEKPAEETREGLAVRLPAAPANHRALLWCQVSTF